MKLFIKLITISCFLLIFRAPLINSFAEEEYSSEKQAKEEETAKLVVKQTKPGTYPVMIKFKQQDEIIEKEILCTIIGEDTKEKGQFAINADAAQITPNQVNELAINDWLTLTNAYAWNTRTGEAVPIMRVNDSEIQSSPGNYPLTIESVDGLSITVQIEVLDTTKTKMLHFYQKNEGKWSEQYNQKGNITWHTFEKITIIILQITLLFVLLLPLICLIIQYIMTSKLVKQVIYLIFKS